MHLKPTRLITATFAYMLLPWLIFLAGWFRPVLGWTLFLVTLVAFSLIIRQIIFTTQNASHLVLTRIQVLSVILVSLGITYISGSGEFFWQDFDYYKHNLVFNDLVNKQWPVEYQHEGKPVFLCYNIAYYLPPALAGKLFGIGSVAIAAYLYTTIGVVLFFLWVACLVNTLQWKYLLAFIFISGFEVLWILAQLVYFLAIWYPEYSFWDILVYVKQNNTTEIITPYMFQMYISWLSGFIGSPQHVLSGYLSSLMVVYFIISKLHPKYTAIVLVLLVLWSPLSIVGVSIFALYHLWQERKTVFSGIKSLWPAAVLCSILFFAGMIYMQAHFPLKYKRWIWEVDIPYFPHAAWIVFTIGFVIFDFGIIFWWLFYREKKLRFMGPYKPLAVISVVALTAICFYQVGVFNDLSTRASVPFLVVMLLLVIIYLQKISTGTSWKRLLVWSVVLVMFLPRFYTIGKRVKSNYDGGINNFFITDIPKDSTLLQHNSFLDSSRALKVMNYTENGVTGPPDIMDQYLGDTSSFYYKHLARRHSR